MSAGGSAAVAAPAPHEAAPWLLRRAAASPAALALRSGELALSYAELARRVDALAVALRREGVAPGRPLAVLCAGALEAALCLHAAQRCGAILLPLNTRLSAPELGFQLADSGARTLVFDPALAPEAEALARESAAVALELALSPAGEFALRRVADPASAGDAAAPCDVPLCRHAALATPLAWLYTSGTTGRPKAAELSQRSFLASARGHAALLGLRAGEGWLACLPLFHVGGLAILVRCTLASAFAELHDRFDPERVCEALASGRIGLVSLVPTMLARVLDAWGERPAPSALRAVLLGGAGAPPGLLERARALHFPVAPSYGLTEAASQVATRLPEEARAPLAARLRPLPGTELRIEAEDGAVLAQGEVGEVCVRGGSLMTRYVRQPEATREALRGGWLHTDDLGRLDAEGGLEILDRRADLIVSGGENIYPAEVEAALLEHPAVAEAAVVARPDGEWGARPVAFVVARGETPPDPGALARHCRARLAGYKVPVAFQLVGALPRNASGKLLRGALRAQALEAGL